MRRSALRLVSLMLLAGCAMPSAPDARDERPTGVATAPTASAQRDPCAADQVGLAEVLAVEPEQRAACFGAKSISFRAYVSSMIGVGGYPEQLSPGDGWLDPYLTPRRLLVPVPGEDQRVLAALVTPAMTLDDVPTDRWAMVTGHFADPASRRLAGVPTSMAPRRWMPIRSRPVARSSSSKASCKAADLSAAGRCSGCGGRHWPGRIGA